MPLLFAPLLPSAFVATAAAAKRCAAAWRASPATRRRGGAASLAPPGADAVALALAACVVVPLATLSLAPHQEPRFLLPLLLPLAALGGAGALASPRRRAAFLGYNGLLAVFFGAVHQAGVLPATAAVAAAALPDAVAAALPARCSAAGLALPVHAVFWRTYPPPQSMLLQPLHSEGAHATSPRVRVTDLGDVPAAALEEALAAAAAHSAEQGGCELRLLVAPAFAPPPHGAQRIARTAPHFSGETAAEAMLALRRGAPLLDVFGLAVYALQA